MQRPNVYYQPPGSGPRCSTASTARLREKRFAMGYETLSIPPQYQALAESTKQVFLEYEPIDPSLARAKALMVVVENAPISLTKDTGLLGGEDPFFFNLMYDTLRADRYGHFASHGTDKAAEKLLQASVFYGPCFEGHITPGLDYILAQGIHGLRARISEAKGILNTSGTTHAEKNHWYDATLIACDAVLIYADRYRQAALLQADATSDQEWKSALREGAELLRFVPEHPAQTFVQALQSYWIVYCLVTLEMGGCMPGGGLGLGRPDQYLTPYFQRDIENGILSREEALMWLERFLLCFRHVDYYTHHQVYTPGSQASLGGVTPSGIDASNTLTELIMEASLRIAMPAPYLSLRLHKDAPERYWQAASAYVAGGLGFPIVNDEVLIPAFLRHGRALGDARDYICSCCYENTIPGREAFNPNGTYLNLPYILELTLNNGISQLTGEPLALAVMPSSDFETFDSLLQAFRKQLEFVINGMVGMVNRADAAHATSRRYPLMSVFIDDCIANGKDVCAGGARYNLTGCIVAGLPNVVNSLAAIQHCVFEEQYLSIKELREILRSNFEHQDALRQKLLAAPKWGNGEHRVDQIARWLTDLLYTNLAAASQCTRWALASCPIQLYRQSSPGQCRGRIRRRTVSS